MTEIAFLRLIAAASGGVIVGGLLVAKRLHWYTVVVLVLCALGLWLTAVDAGPWTIVTIGIFFLVGLVQGGAVIEDVIRGRRRRLKAAERAAARKDEPEEWANCAVATGTERAEAQAAISKKPCPFCGGEADLTSEDRFPEVERGGPGPYVYYGRCRSCAGRGGWAESPTGAVRYWVGVKPAATAEEPS